MGLRRRSRPFLDVLTYQVPDGVAPPLRGARVVVPLGKRVVTGIVVNPAATLDAGADAPARRSKTLSTCSTIMRSCRNRSSPRACGWPSTTRAEQVTRSQRRPLDTGPQDASHRDADRTRTDEQIVLRGRHEGSAGWLRARLRMGRFPLSTREASRRCAAAARHEGVGGVRHQRIERESVRSGVATTLPVPPVGRVLTGEQSRRWGAAAAAATEQFSVFLLQGVTGRAKRSLPSARDLVLRTAGRCSYSSPRSR